MRQFDWEFIWRATRRIEQKKPFVLASYWIYFWIRDFFFFVKHTNKAHTVCFKSIWLLIHIKYFLFLINKSDVCFLLYFFLGGLYYGYWISRSSQNKNRVNVRNILKIDEKYQLIIYINLIFIGKLILDACDNNSMLPYIKVIEWKLYYICDVVWPLNEYLRICISNYDQFNLLSRFFFIISKLKITS